MLDEEELLDEEEELQDVEEHDESSGALVVDTCSGRREIATDSASFCFFASDIGEQPQEHDQKIFSGRRSE